MARLLILGPEGRRFEYKVDRDKMNIGRVDGNDLVLAYSSVSRKHALLEKRIFGYYLMDNNSTNGTIVNGEYIKEKKLNDRDEIFLGELMMVFFYDDTEYEDTQREKTTPEVPAEPPLPPPPQVGGDPKSTLEIDISKIRDRFRKEDPSKDNR